MHPKLQPTQRLNTLFKVLHSLACPVAPRATWATPGTCLATSLLLTVGLSELSAAPPRMLLQGDAVADKGAAGGGRTSFAIARMPDGSFAFYDRNRPDAGPLELPDRDGQSYTLLPTLPAEIAASRAILDSGALANAQVVLTPDRHVVSVIVKAERLDRDTAAQVGLPLYLDLWVTRANPSGADEPRMFWRGYNGSQMEYERLPGGRILVPFGSFQPHAKAVPPHGRHQTIILYSDDGGQTWRESESKLIAPCYAGFNGSNEGACEPAIEQLRDGSLWMLMRSQTGFLYESSSRDNGATWDQASASRFSTSTGPPNIMRHKNGWLVVCWNNCELPPRHEGAGVYGGRDALHIAVSSDEGRTWRGFREIYLDHRRNDNPAQSGDRGTAYPLAAYTADGQIVVLAGQGHGGRNPILVDPAWIVETSASSDFSDGLEQWSVHKHHGPAKGWWRARAVGCQLVAHPSNPAARCLNVRKADELPADGATWNFPNGWRGSLTARLMIRQGFHGGVICLNDRMFDPANDFGEQFAIFQAAIERDGQLGEARLRPGTWHDVTLKWDLSAAQCELQVDGRPAGRLPLRCPTLNGISYVRFRSAATVIDAAGVLVERVEVTIDDPLTPVCSPADRQRQERWYVENVVPTWQAGR
ncbi:MAG: exo-alpha-sialidase [Pirellulaceae bacterium]|nr:exo-alpha-sialidase [Pirellulaceae bacterium]